MKLLESYQLQYMRAIQLTCSWAEVKVSRGSRVGGEGSLKGGGGVVGVGNI